MNSILCVVIRQFLFYFNYEYPMAIKHVRCDKMKKNIVCVLHFMIDFGTFYAI